VKKLAFSTALALVLSATNVDAASFNCGRWMCKRVGIANCGSLALALEWSRKFTRVAAPAPGVVVVQRRSGRALGGGPGGHVSRVVRLTDNPCKAIVEDNRGVRPRDICSRRVALVSVGGMWTE
jgi:hypothetical protein